MHLFFTEALLPNGWTGGVRLRLAEGRIAAIQTGASAQPGDERHGIGLPGLPNLHSHAFQRGMAGLAERRGPAADSFWTWRERMYRFVGVLGPDDVEAVAAQAYAEMLEGGFTRVAEFHYLHHGPGGTPYADPAELGARVGAAARQTGIGLAMLPVFYAHGGFGGQGPAGEQARFVNDLDGFSRLLDATRAALAGLPGTVVGIAPHSLRAVTPGEIAAIIPLAAGGPVHIHVAEQAREVEDCLAWSGQRPVEWLLGHAPVDRNWCLIHATHATPDEIRRMAATGAVAGLCPVTEANLGDGTFDAAGFVLAGGAYGVGTDSNVSIGVADELRQLEYSQRLRHRARNVLATEEGASTGRCLYDAAVRGGSRATGLAAAGILVGAAADLVSLDEAHVALAGRSGDDVLDALIFAGGRGVVDCVWVRGHKLVEQGRHHAADAIAARFRRALARLLEA